MGTLSLWPTITTMPFLSRARTNLSVAYLLWRRPADRCGSDPQCLRELIGRLQRALPLADVNGGHARIRENTRKRPGTLLANARQHTVWGFVLRPLGVPKYEDSLLRSGDLCGAGKNESE